MLTRTRAGQTPPAYTLNVELAARTYPIHIGPGLLNEAATLIRTATPAQHVALVTDETVARHYRETVQDNLAAAGFRVTVLTVAPGEPSKCFDTLQRIVDGILTARLERGDAVAALGGGVVGDLAGFAAAIARRGMDFIQIPTTLLAQVDSSVGGKTGINVPQGKNLVGAFHQPKVVIADTETLKTLPPREFAAGYCELAKAALILDVEFFESLERDRAEIFGGGPACNEAIARACAIKAGIVAEDEREHGRRALLNLGHTFGHALEAWCGYDAGRLIHGEAIAIGIALAFRFSRALGLAPQTDTDRVEAHLKACGLPTVLADIPGGNPDPATLVEIMHQDKKVERGALAFILAKGIGKAYVAHDIEPESVRLFLEGQR